MALELEGKEKIICAVPGSYQKDLTSRFRQTLFALTEDGIYVYDDHLPDSSVQGSYIYKIHAKLSYSDLLIVLIVDLKGDKNFLYKKKLQFVAENQDLSLILYLRKDEVKYLKRLTEELKRRKIRIERKSLKLDI